MRNPACLLLAAALSAGISGVADWSITMAAVFVLAIVADAADHLARHARARRERRTATLSALRTRGEAAVSAYEDLAA